MENVQSFEDYVNESYNLNEAREEWKEGKTYMGYGKATKVKKIGKDKTEVTFNNKKKETYTFSWDTTGWDTWIEESLLESNNVEIDSVADALQSMYAILEMLSDPNIDQSKASNASKIISQSKLTHKTAMQLIKQLETLQKEWDKNK